MTTGPHGRLTPRPVLGCLLTLLLVVSFGACGRGESEPSQVHLGDAFASEGTEAVAAYLLLSNAGGPDAIVDARLVGSDVGLARQVSLHIRGERSGLSIMKPADEIPVEGKSTQALAPAQAHLMLEGLTAPLAAGDDVAMEIVLASGEVISAHVRVVDADEAIALLTEDLDEPR